MQAMPSDLEIYVCVFFLLQGEVTENKAKISEKQTYQKQTTTIQKLGSNLEGGISEIFFS